ncbi:MAG TPA: bifunctional DNA primase/polymerase [Gaiellales bacterium]|nr:bifunctional DNA primase/polymerase [Gaiellales bacterium]
MYENLTGERNVLDETIEWARTYIEYGFALVPVKGKRPNFNVLKRRNGNFEWGRYCTNKATIEEVADWVTIDPTTGIGIITGTPSKLVVADYDSATAPDLRTASVQTAKGHHLYLHHEMAMPTRETAFGDLKADGGYVVAPPSPTVIGTSYTWVPNRGLDEIGLMPYEAAASLFTSSTPTIPLGVNVFTPKGKGSTTPSSEWLASWDKDARFVSAVCERLGIPAKGVGKNFRCVLPGHQETHPSASLTHDKNGAVVYHDWHRRDGQEFFLLAEVYAAVTAGKVVKLNKPELARWKLRLLVETGVVAAPAVTLPPLTSANSTQTKVYDGLRLLIQARTLADDPDPFPFTASFVSRWCAITEDQAKLAIRFIRDQGLLTIAGKFPSGVHTGHLYLPAGSSDAATSTWSSTTQKTSPPA